MIQLLEHFTYKKLIRFTIPTVAMMIFTSVYGVVDGLFVSNVAGSESFAGVNLIMPALMMLGSVGFMIGILFMYLLDILVQAAVLLFQRPLARATKNLPTAIFQC